jgi:LuxR family maltose regulon positive regulatory protein
MKPGNRQQTITTKVLQPPGALVIERPRLLEAVAQGQMRRLSLIKAPAGFGKTSLAIAWAERLARSGHLVAWFSIDTDDNEPTQFLYYLCHAIRRACNGAGGPALDLMHESSLISPQAVISTLINDLAEIDDEVCLFLEDYHCVTDATIHGMVGFLLRHAPPHFHLIVVTRSEPPLPVAELRAQNKLFEIDTEALRFTVEEVQRFFEYEGLGRLDQTELRLLLQRSEGWPAVLRIVASTVAQSGATLGQYARQPSGMLTPIGAYLAEMVDSLPQEMASFMLRTAILDRLSAPLCQAVTQHPSSRELLESIAQRQLLLSPLDHNGRWFRYHTLLAEYLRQRLETELGQETALLHRRAAHWYAMQEQWTDAVQHAIAAGDKEQAAIWVTNCAMELVKKGELLTLLGWQRLFPKMRHPIKLRLALAWGMALAVRLDEAFRLLDDIEGELRDEPSPENTALASECMAIRSCAIALGDDTHNALSVAEACLSLSDDPWAANVASNVARYGYLKSAKLSKFYSTPWIPYSLDEDKRNLFASVYRRCIQGVAELQQLRLATAERHYLDAVALAEQHVGPHSVAAALPISLLAQIRYEQGRMDEAERLLLDRIQILNSAGWLECVLSAYVVLVRSAAVRMNFARAYTLLEQAENLGLSRRWGRLTAAALFERVRLLCLEGRISESLASLERLDHLAAEYSAPSLCAWSDVHRYCAFARARVSMAQGDINGANSILKSLQHEANEAHNYYFGVRVTIDLAAGYLRSGQRDEAVAAIRKVLNAGLQSGLHQIFLDQGPEFGTLLSNVRDDAVRAKDSAAIASYIDHLIEDCRVRYQPKLIATSAPANSELLSLREIDILDLIAQGRSNKEIARVLSIAPETVKSHVKNIFSKLNVEKRAQAVSRAQNLGLLATPHSDYSAAVAV